MLNYMSVPKNCWDRMPFIPRILKILILSNALVSLIQTYGKHICILTQPLSPKAIKKANTSHVRKMRRFFCVCTLLYITNAQCSFPLHVLLADAIETCGGSNRLARLFNRFGACASPDTHARYVQYRVDKSKKRRANMWIPWQCFHGCISW